jgi:hypothetical protein
LELQPSKKYKPTIGAIRSACHGFRKQVIDDEIGGVAAINKTRDSTTVSSTCNRSEIIASNDIVVPSKSIEN